MLTVSGPRIPGNRPPIPLGQQKVAGLPLEWVAGLLRNQWPVSKWNAWPVCPGIRTIQPKSRSCSLSLCGKCEINFQSSSKASRCPCYQKIALGFVCSYRQPRQLEVREVLLTSTQAASSYSCSVSSFLGWDIIILSPCWKAMLRQTAAI